MYDFVIRNGLIVDGSGQREPYVGDVAIQGKRIAAVGSNLGPGRKEIDAKGLLVTPGFVDIHTHYDAQASWDPYLTPSSFHGVTTTVMGNCGVGFAPCRKEDHDTLITMMEGVEDIPGIAMTEGLTWDWESMPEYMQALERQPHAIDFGCQITHGALRTFVMGARGVNNEAATDEDIEEMRRLTLEALNVGALGFSTSRTMLHRSLDGNPVPGTFADERELLGIAEALREAGRGVSPEGEPRFVFQFSPEHMNVPHEFAWMRKFAEISGQKVCFNLNQTDWAPDIWRDVLVQLEQAEKDGLPIYAQVAGRSIGVCMSLELTAHPFVGHPSFEAVKNLPKGEKLAKLRDPEVRARIISETPAIPLTPFEQFVTRAYDKMFVNTNGIDYEPKTEESLGFIARKENKNPLEVAYDALVTAEGFGMMYMPLLNYSYGDLSFTEAVQTHRRTRMGLSDAGAHCGAVCDGGVPTFMLTHWGRDRARGEKLALPWLIHRQTRETAEFYGFFDRGLIEVGMKADINVIDFENLSLGEPEVVFDLPANGRRLLQKAKGYRATFCSGELILENDELTGALPGKLLRGEQKLEALGE